MRKVKQSLIMLYVEPNKVIIANEYGKESI